MNALDQPVKNESRPAGIGPGERLQAARIQQGLSIEDVSSRMHLSPNILEALEENDFEEITAPIFVKGYLRAYARIVSLDEDEMIQQYLDFYSDEDPPISSTSNMAPELSVADARIRWTTYLVVLVLATLLVAWWWNKEQNDEATISLDTQTAGQEQSEQAGMPVVDSQIEAISETRQEAQDTIAAGDTAEVAEPVGVVAVENEAVAAESAEIIAMQQVGDGDSAAIETTEVAEVESSATETSATETSAAEMSGTETSATEPSATESSAMDAQPNNAAAPAAPVQSGGLIAPSGSDKLHILVHADTWADIKDGSDYQMVYDLLRAEQSVELTGAAPFTVFLGNGHGVEIRINGEEFDFSSRIRDDNTARLKIGG